MVFGRQTTVHLADHAKLHGNFNLGTFAPVTVEGGKGSELVVDEKAILFGAHMTVDADVSGHGTFIVEPGQYHYGPPAAGLEFGAHVGSGVHVDLTGTGFPGSYGSTFFGLVIDHPGEFNGSVTLHQGGAGGEADLKDMAQAASWSFRDDVLTIADANGHAIDKLQITDQAPGFNGGLALSRTATGEVLVSPGTDFRGLLALPTS
jgi:hypothetical protein